MSRYDWEERIATGGMGEVWRARDTVLSRQVAVKVLKPDLADDARFRERFATEARNAASLHHPNIATVFDYGELAGDPPRPYLVMELVRGRPLSDVLQAGRPVDPEQARQIAAQTADALAAAHEAGIVHRDIKPGNILLTPQRQVKVTDFGIARAADAVPLTTTGEMIGTPHYVSPEQAEGRQATPASDVYALGVVLYEMLAGKRPFTADSAVATALAHVRETPQPLPGTVPSDLAAIVERCLAKDPADRFRDAAQLARALRDPGSAPAPAPRPGPVAVPVPAPVPLPEPEDATRVIPATQVTPVAPVPPVTRTTTTRAEDDEPERTRDSGSKALVPILAVLAVLVLVGLIYLLTRGNGEADQASGETTPTPSETTASPSDTASAAEPVTHEIDEDDYVGQEVGRAKDRLREAGFDSISVRTRSNPGGEDAGTVVAISPTGTVRETSTIFLTVWGEEEPDESPSSTPSDESSGPSTPSPPGNGNSNGPGPGNNGNGN